MQLARFDIRPRRSRLFYTVRVFSTKASMHEYARRHVGRGLGRKYRGLASAWVKQRYVGGRWRRRNHAGGILLVRRHMGVEIISHECAHLALAWAERVRVNPLTPSKGLKVSSENERFCYALGELVAATYRELWRRKLVA